MVNDARLDENGGDLSRSLEAALELALEHSSSLQKQVLGFRLQDGLDFTDIGEILSLTPFRVAQEFMDAAYRVRSVMSTAVSQVGIAEPASLPPRFRVLLPRVEAEPGTSDSGVTGLAAAIDSLSGNERLLVSLRFKEELTLAEIAEVVGGTRSSVLDALEGAVGSLASEMRDEAVARRLHWFTGIAPRTAALRLAIEAVVTTVRELTPGLIKYLQRRADDLRLLNGAVFEHLVAEFLAQRGFEQVQLVGREAQTSADIFAVKHIHAINLPVRVFVEVKRWREKVGIGVINQVHGAMLMEQPKFGWNAALIVSHAGFADLRKESAHAVIGKTIHLRDREDLLRWLGDYQPNDAGLWLPSRSATSLATVLSEVAELSAAASCTVKDRRSDS